MSTWLVSNILTINKSLIDNSYGTKSTTYRTWRHRCCGDYNYSDPYRQTVWMTNYSKTQERVHLVAGLHNWFTPEYGELVLKSFKIIFTLLRVLGSICVFLYPRTHAYFPYITPVP